MKRIAVLAWLFLPLVGCGRPPELSLPPEGALLPLTQEGKIQAILPDGRTLVVLLDTGATCSSLVRADLTRLALASTTSCLPSPTIKIDHTEWFHRYVRLDRLALGEAHIRDLDLDTKNHGVTLIGQDVLVQCAFLLDQTRKEARLLPSEGLASRLEALYPGRRWTKLPVTWKYGVPLVQMPLQDGREIDMLVDTGCNVTILESKTVKTLGLSPASGKDVSASLGITITFNGIPLESEISTKVSLGSGDATATAHETQAFHLEGLRIAGEERKIVVFSYESRFFSISCNILGMDQLGQTPFVLDGPGNTLWIAEKPKP